MPLHLTNVFLTALVVVGRPAVDYLSDFDFPGLHILERTREGFRLYPKGQKPKSSATEGRLVLRIDDSMNMSHVRASLESILAIPSREPYQSDWALFDSQGRRLSTVEALRAVETAFITEIGQWMWPAVRKGFEHIAEGIAGDSSRKLRTLSVRPVVFEVEDFIDPKECEEIIRLGKKQGLVASKGMMQSSDLEKGTDDSSFRTSKQTWLSNGASKVVSILDYRTANLTRVDKSHNEPVQVLRYDAGTFYHGHMDWAELELYPDQRNQWLHQHYGHQDRLATVFWYLNTVKGGGETIFPKYDQPVCPTYQQRNCAGAYDPDMASCAKGLKVPPQRGTVILWYNFHPSGRGDRNALHAGCPPEKGLVKWSGNKWINIKPLRTPPAKWVSGHPALKRMQWRGDQPADPDECKAMFRNEAQMEVEIIWGGDESAKAEQAIGTRIPPGKVRSLDSRRGHIFYLKRTDGINDGPVKSNEVTCKPPQSKFVLTKDFKLLEKKLKKKATEL